jgi:excisionase family DNA binding protein
MRNKVINDKAARQSIDQSSDSLLTKKELAPHLGVGPRTVSEWMRKGRVPFLKIGKTVRFRLADVLEKLNAYRVN